MTTTVKSALAGPTEEIAMAMLPSIAENVVVVPLIRKEDLPVNTLTKTVMIDSELSGGVDVAEAANFATASQYTRTSINLTVGKTAISSRITVEAQDFGQVSIADLATKQGRQLARRMDGKVTELFDNFANSVTATARLTVDDVHDALYVLETNLLGSFSTPAAVLSKKQVFDLQKEIIKSAASVYTLPGQISLLGSSAQNPNNGYRGDLLGVPVFEAHGLPTAGGDTVGLIFDREQAFFGCYATAPVVMIIAVGQGNPSFNYEVSAYLHNGAIELRDLAGVSILSDS